MVHKNREYLLTTTTVEQAAEWIHQGYGLACTAYHVTTPCGQFILANDAWVSDGMQEIAVLEVLEDLTTHSMYVHETEGITATWVRELDRLTAHFVKATGPDRVHYGSPFVLTVTGAHTCQHCA